jgi:small subunit ribosomal protein S20
MKRHRQSLKRRARNRVSKTRIKNTVKAVRLAIEEKDTTKAQELLKEASSVLDKAARKNVIQSRQAQRRIARLQTAVNKIAE